MVAVALNPSPVAVVRRARKTYRVLMQVYPDARCELNFENPFQLVVATMLSAQTTDVAVNSVTQQLFHEYPDPWAMAAADRSNLEQILRPTGFFRAKADAALRLSAMLVTDFNGQVPRTLPELVKLPGVGRKTANVVLGNAFNVPGLTVDTHFGRLVRRFGWTNETDPVKVETAIATLFPPSDWTSLSHVLIFHGRRTCQTRKPACGACPVFRWCASYGIGEMNPAAAAKRLRFGHEPRAQA